MKETPLQITPHVLQTVIWLCRSANPREACGFIVAPKEIPEIGIRVHPMENVASGPVDAGGGEEVDASMVSYVMDDEAVIKAYRQFDEQGEEVVAVWHSHPRREPVMSGADLELAHNVEPAYLIISLKDGHPSAAAWRVQRFIGAADAQQVAIKVVEASAHAPIQPIGPWALTPGNRVRIGYRRTGKTATSYVVATVTGLGHEQVSLNPDRNAGPRTLVLERIDSIHVLQEGEAGQALRREMRAQAWHATTLLAAGEVPALPALIDGLARAFEPRIKITMEVS